SPRTRSLNCRSCSMTRTFAPFSAMFLARAALPRPPPAMATSYAVDMLNPPGESPEYTWLCRMRASEKLRGKLREANGGLAVGHVQPLVKGHDFSRAT